jgi:hypothetical protein
MDKRLNKKIDSYITQFKGDIKEKASQLGIKEETTQLLQYIYDYERLSLGKDDFMKRKRVKNTVSLYDRCCAKRASGEQCTRRRKNEDEYCGTHMKGTPHGIIENTEEAPTTQKIEVWAQDIQGIIYYIDKNNNVYQTEDIFVNKPDPKIIAKYVKNENHYSIPAFGL